MYHYVCLTFYSNKKKTHTTVCFSPFKNGTWTSFNGFSNRSIRPGAPVPPLFHCYNSGQLFPSTNPGWRSGETPLCGHFWHSIILFIIRIFFESSFLGAHVHWLCFYASLSPPMWTHHFFLCSGLPHRMVLNYFIT